MKKVFLPLVLLLLCSILVTACSSGTSTPTQPAASSPTASQSATASQAPTSAVTIKPTTTSSSVTTPASTAPASTTQPTGTAPKYGGTLRYGTLYSPGNPTGVPWMSVGPTTVSTQISEEALIRQMSNGTDVPVLATSWDVDLTGPSIIFHLRKGVKFSDGSDFNAAAVKWNFEHQMGSDSVNTSATNTWKSIEVIDDYTVKISFSAWQNTHMENFANSVSFMVSPTAYEKNGLDWMKYNMVGTGPFIQKTFQRDVALTAVKNTNYWNTGKPYLDGIQMLYVSDDLTRGALYKSGALEVLDNGRNARLAREYANAGNKIVTMNASGNVSLIPDSMNPDSPWANIKVRQAAEYAIDKKSLVDAFGFGYLHPLYQMYLPGTMTYDAALESQYRTYDVAKAKQLMTEAGYPNGFKTTIIVYPSGVDQNMVLTVQSYLQKIGIQTEIQMPQSAAFTNFTMNGWKNAILFSPLQLWVNPNHTFNYFFNYGMTNYVSMKRPDGWKDLLTASQATATPDPALVKKMEDALFNDTSLIPLTDSVYPWIVSNTLQDHGIGTTSTVGFFTPANAWLNK